MSLDSSLANVLSYKKSPDYLDAIGALNLILNIDVYQFRGLDFIMPTHVFSGPPI